MVIPAYLFSMVVTYMTEKISTSEQRQSTKSSRISHAEKSIRSHTDSSINYIINFYCPVMILKVFFVTKLQSRINSASVSFLTPNWTSVGTIFRKESKNATSSTPWFTLIYPPSPKKHEIEIHLKFICTLGLILDDYCCVLVCYPALSYLQTYAWQWLD